MGIHYSSKRIFLSQGNITQEQLHVLNVDNYSTSFNQWFCIQAEREDGEIASYEIPSKLESTYTRAKNLLIGHIVRGDTIKLSCQILNNEIQAQVSANKYYTSRIEIKKIIEDSKEQIIAVLYTTSDWCSEEREEFYTLFKSGYTKEELFTIFGRENIDREWDSARVRAGKESVKTNKTFKDYFIGLEREYDNVIYGASHNIQFGEKCWVINGRGGEKPKAIPKEETLFYCWDEFLKYYKESFPDDKDDIEFRFEINLEHSNKFKFFSDNYYSFAPIGKNETIDVHIRIEEFQGEFPTAYSFYFHKRRKNDPPIDVFSQYGVAFIRYIMHLKDLVYQDSFSGYEGLANEKKKISIKSAVSAIMSRNMSHNLGSHCIQYTGTSLLELAKHSIQYAPQIRGVASLLLYIQGRMDFLAALISYERFSPGPVDFKFQVLNRLLQDDVVKLKSEEIDLSKYKALIGNTKLSSTINAFCEKLENPGRDINGLVNRYGEMLTSLADSESNFDDNKKLTYNYILENLVKSENYTRTGKGRIDIRFKINGKYIEPNSYESFNIAVPGGTLSSHAFFIIFENLIRNAAKHNPQRKGEDLLETIVVKTNDNDQSADIMIYDNKNNADIVNKRIKEKLAELQILDDSQQVDKKNKGLKEILFAALWLRAFENKRNFQEILYEIDNATGRHKLELIEKYAFQIVTVIASNGDRNFGIQLTLPLYKTYTTLIHGYSLQELNKGNFDIILCETDDLCKKIQPVYPRAYSEKSLDISNRMKNSVLEEYDSTNNFCIGSQILHNIIKRDFGIDSEKIAITIGTEGFNVVSSKPENTIYFKRHLNSNRADLEDAKKYLYADSVSGNNHTNALCMEFLEGINNGQFVNWKHKYQSLKIIESALTRITIIDERFLGAVPSLELQLKNIRVLNLRSDIKRATSLADVFEGTDFKDQKNETTFLSIHLGIIEKLLENNGNWFEKGYNGYKRNHECDISRIEYLLIILKIHFGRKGKPLYISIHSGRGNYSYEMESYFKEYPFITLSSLWDAFYDSKYHLTQLFNNNRYSNKIGNLILQ